MHSPARCTQDFAQDPQGALTPGAIDVVVSDHADGGG